MVGVAVAVAIAVATRWWYVPVAAAAFAAVVRSGASVSPSPCSAQWRCGGPMSSWAALQPDELGPFDGWATVVGETAAGGRRRPGRARWSSGERYEVWVRGRAGRQRIEQWHPGDRVRVEGDRESLWRRLVDDASRGSTSSVSSTSAGSATSCPATPAAAASNRVRELIRRGAGVLPADRAALARGLLIGDDRDEPPR